MIASFGMVTLIGHAATGIIKLYNNSLLPRPSETDDARHLLSSLSPFFIIQHIVVWESIFYFHFPRPDLYPSLLWFITTHIHILDIKVTLSHGSSSSSRRKSIHPGRFLFYRS